MKTVWTAAVAALGIAWASGCGTGPHADPNPDGLDGGTAAVAPTYHADVKAIVDRKCAGCHTPGGEGPFSLETYADVAKRGDRVLEAVTNRTMPPWPYSADCTDYADDVALGADEIGKLAAWVKAGMPEGEPDTATKTVPPTPLRVDASLRMAEPYAMKTTNAYQDEYRCFVLDWPLERPTFVRGFEARPGSIQHVHHAIAFLVPASESAAYAKRDAADPGPGYACFGTPGGTQFTSLGSWAPGVKGAVRYPEDTGVRVEPGAKIVLQMHYHPQYRAGDTAPPSDQTAFDFEVDDHARAAQFLMTTNPDWVVSKMPIAPGAAHAEVSYAADLSLGRPFTLFDAGVHMHLLGKRGVVRIERANGERECLVDTTWDFRHQRGYRLARPRRIFPGDRVTFECHWDNSAENQPVVDGRKQPPRQVTWGENTTDEMCVLGAYILRDPREDGAP